MSLTSRSAARSAPLAAARRLVAALLAAGLPAALAGCGDNITCVFTTGCNDTGGGPLGTNAAVLPVDGQRILDTAPVVQTVVPAANDAHPSTPVAVVFSESMNEATLDQIGLFQDAGIFAPVEVTTKPFVVASGRVLVLLPDADLDPGQYFVRVSGTDPITDLTGQPLAAADGTDLGMFRVDDMTTAPPSVLLTFPEEGEDDASDTPEIVVLFDRAVNPASVNGTTFDVRVGGTPPTPDPAPTRIGDPLASFARAYVYHSVTAAGVATSFGPAADVSVTISPAATPILDADGDDVAERVLSFTTTVVVTPPAVRILSQPTDAIGIANLDRLDPLRELEIEIDLDDGRTGDLVDLFLVGLDPAATPARRVALRRGITLQGAGPFPSASFDAAAVDLTISVSPLETRFGDGTLAVAARTRRGSATSPLRLLDVDASLAGIQDPLLDTQGPTIEELYGSAGATSTFVTAQRRICLAGRADEQLRSVEVVSGPSDNGTLPPVVGSDGAGNFLAAPVAFDLASPTSTYSAVGYDRALNPSAPIAGTSTHVGIVGPDPFAPGDPLTVEVFHALTLRPVAGALVLVHADDGVTVTLEQMATTDALGLASFASAGAGAAEVLVTVVQPGFDLFTFHGVPARRMSIPLGPTIVPANATVLGQVQGDVAGLATTSLVIADTRRPAGADTFYDVGPCAGTPISCPHGPEFVVVGRPGSQSLLGGDFQQAAASFSAALLVKIFELSVPRPPVASGQQDVADVRVLRLLSDAPAAERVVELPPVVLDGSAALGVDFADLDGDPTFTGDARVLVEATLPGLELPVPVGLGLAFLQGGSTDVWNVRSAVPGDALGAGALAAAADDLFLRLEVRDGSGARSVRRPRTADLSLGATVLLDDVPGLVSPAPGGASGGTSFDVLVDDRIPDGFPGTGFHRIRLTDSVGRSWSLWRLDAAGTQVRFHVPDVSPATGLADGSIALVATAISIPTAGAPPGFGPAAFLWTDLEREHDARVTSPPFTFTQP